MDSAGWIVCTVHPILSARELHFHMEADSLNRPPIHCGSLVHPHCHSYPGHLDAMPAHTLTPLSTGTVWHGDPCIIFSPLVHLNTKGFLLKNRQQWFFLPVVLQAGWPPISSDSSFIIISTKLLGGKGHSWSHWWDKIRLQRREMGVDVRLALAYHFRVNAEKDKLNYRHDWMEHNLPPQEWRNGIN